MKKKQLKSFSPMKTGTKIICRRQVGGVRPKKRSLGELSRQTKSSSWPGRRGQGGPRGAETIKPKIRSRTIGKEGSWGLRGPGGGEKGTSEKIGKAHAAGFLWRYTSGGKEAENFRGVNCHGGDRGLVPSRK